MHEGGAGSSVCVNSWCEPDPRWGCIGSPPNRTGDLGRFVVTLHVQDMLSQQPLAGVTARLCRRLDVNCETSPHRDLLSDEQGDVRFDVNVDSDQGFTGYVQFTRADLMPGLYFFNPPIDRNVDVPSLQLLAGALTKLAGTPYDPQRGLILLNTFDCSEKPADGVTLETEDADQRSTSFYSVDGLPSDEGTATDSTGYGGVINAPPGTIAVRGRLATDRRLIGTVSVLVRPRTITYSRMVPGGN